MTWCPPCCLPWETELLLERWHLVSLGPRPIDSQSSGPAWGAALPCDRKGSGVAPNKWALKSCPSGREVLEKLLGRPRTAALEPAAQVVVDW